jgi:DNA-binding MarR family transcriptional regulator
VQRSSAPQRAALRVVDQPRADAAFERDALRLHRSLSELVRVFQFRDRDRICCHDISVTQCYALEALVQRADRGTGSTLNELAADLYLDKSTASRVVDALVAKGYAARGPHPEDGRAVLLTPTAAGRRLYARIDGELLAEAREVLAGFPAEVRESMNELLQRLHAACAARILDEACCPPAHGGETS